MPRRLAAEGLRRYPGFTDLVFARRDSPLRLAHSTTRGALPPVHRARRRAHALPAHGRRRHLPAEDRAGQLALKDGDDELARQLLAWCLERYPTFHMAVTPYLSLLLRAGMRAEAAVAEVERRLESVTPTVRFMLGSALLDAGALPAAERQYRSVVADQPDNAQARIALAETLLRSGDNAGAASQAALVSEDDTRAAAAFGIELCALISGGNLGAASDALAGRG